MRLIEPPGGMMHRHIRKTRGILACPERGRN
jgi:hypothetical protein